MRNPRYPLQGRPSGSLAGWVTLSLGLTLMVASCASPTVIRKSESPLTRAVPGSGDYQWKPKSGWVKPDRGRWGTAAQIRVESKKAFEASEYADALVGYLAYLEALPSGDVLRSEAHYYVAECYYFLGNYESAVEHYREAYRNQKPDNEILTRTFQRLHDIAMDYLQEKAACRFLGFNYSCPSRGIDLLVGDGGLLIEYPNLPFADDAIYAIAKHYLDAREYAEAVPVFQRVIEEYPQSEWRARARYNIALATYKQVRGVDYDEKLIEDSERRFREYLESEPRGPQAEDARQKVREITEKMGEKNLNLAKYYLRESQPVAAKIYLTLVLERYTTSLAAREAREIQRQIERY